MYLVYIFLFCEFMAAFTKKLHPCHEVLISNFVYCRPAAAHLFNSWVKETVHTNFVFRI